MLYIQVYHNISINIQIKYVVHKDYKININKVNTCIYSNMVVVVGVSSALFMLYRHIYYNKYRKLWIK